MAEALGSGLPETDLREIAREFEMILEREGSTVVYGGADIANQVARAVELVDDVALRYGQARITAGGDDEPEVPIADHPSPETVVHPRESLRGALALFQAAAPVLTQRLPGADAPQGRILITGLLHRTLMRHLGQEVGLYVNHMLGKINRVREEERHRMARDLHDRTAHTLSVALQNLELHDVYAEFDRANADAKLRAVMEDLRETLESVRQMSMELREPALEGSLGQALTAYLANALPPTIRLRLSCVEDYQVPSVIAEEVYLAVREAIHNAVKHGSPRSLTVSLEVTDIMLSVRVSDDGCGFDPADVQDMPSGVGLRSMRERIELLGGRFVVKSAPGEGTVVETLIPFLKGIM